MKILLRLTTIMFILIAAASCSSAEDSLSGSEKRTVNVESVSEVEVVPEVCLDALDYADELALLGADGYRIAGEIAEAGYDAIQAVLNTDVVAMESVTARMTDINAETESKRSEIGIAVRQYTDARDECRAAAN